MENANSHSAGATAFSGRDLGNAFLAFFYPEWCQICLGNRATSAEGYVCGECAASVRPVEPPFCSVCGRPTEGAITGEFVCGQCKALPPSFVQARSAAKADGPLLKAIHLYKYNRALCVEPFLAGLLISKAKCSLSLERWDCLVPVPLHPLKERERDFNQAYRLAKRLSGATGIPVRSDLVTRRIPTRTQTRLNREERFENMNGAFEARADRSEGLRVVLIDDVFTTGATTNSCTKALLGVGVASVCVWTVARGI